MSTKYDSLYNALMKTRGKAVLRFYDIVKDEPEEYSAFNDPEILDKHGNGNYRGESINSVALDSMIQLFYSLQLESRKNKYRFFELGSTELKFFAEEFPIIYFGMFRTTVDMLVVEAKLTSYTHEVKRPIKSIPYLKQAYHNVPDKFKKAFNGTLLKYYRFLKSERNAV